MSSQTLEVTGATDETLVRAPVAPVVTQTATRLHSLTALRFLAAGIVVIAHVQGNLAKSQGWAYPFALEQGVSFFFVLSGFILTYVYPVLDARRARRFIVARVARIWPMQVVSFLVYLALVPATARTVVSTHPLTSLLNVTLLFGWIPIPQIYAGFSLPSWSISTEFFFYLCFPLILWRWRRTWPIKLAVSFGAMCLMAILQSTQALQHLGAALEPINHSFALLKTVNISGMMYVNPLSRVFEFTLGVGAAHVWKAMRTRITLAPVFATLLEGGLLALVIFVLYHAAGWAAHVARIPGIGPAAGFWMRGSGFNCLPFTALIVVFAFECGLISRFLRFAPFVLLGEISYSTYLIHWPLLSFYKLHTNLFLGVPDHWLLPLFIAVLVLVSYACYSIVELPCRRTLVAAYDRFIEHRQAREAPEASRSRRFAFAYSPWLRGLLALNIVLASVYGVIHRAAAQPPPEVATLSQRQAPALADVNWVGDLPVNFANPSVSIGRNADPKALIVIGGWAIDQELMRPATGAYLALDGRVLYWTQYGIEREDIAGYFKNPSLVRTGYRVEVPLRDLTPGQHLLTVRVLNDDRQSYSESRPITLTVL